MPRASREKKTESKFVCYVCNKTLYLTVECTEFDKKCFDVLLKLKDNLIHIRNSQLETERARVFEQNKIKKRKPEKKLNSFQDKTNDSSKKLEQQINH